jgi:hypothetical protein
MKGIELSEKYFQTHGLPMIMAKFKGYEKRIAAGLVGDGSECFGFDDEFSRDHDWGPGFCVWMVSEDYNLIGKELQLEISRLPQTFMNFGPRIVSKWSPDRIGVFEIPSFYRNFIGMDHLPSTIKEWSVLPENNLATCTNGKVFCDPLGEFSRWRETLLKFYPEDIRLKKIASRCMTIAQSGQYNLKRCLKRKEYFAARHAETTFCTDAISLIFLLNRKYTPFFKWMHRALKELSLLGEWSYLKITELITSPDMMEKPIIIEEICMKIIAALQEEGLTDSLSSFLLDHGPSVQNRIKDANLRQRNVWIG